MEESFCKKMIGADPEVLGYRILLMAPPVPETTRGGIILDKNYAADRERRSNTALVLKIGPECFLGEKGLETFRVEVGDWIHYSTLEREEVFAHDKRCFYINDSRIYARVHEEDVPVFVSAFRVGNSHLKWKSDEYINASSSIQPTSNSKVSSETILPRRVERFNTASINKG